MVIPAQRQKKILEILSEDKIISYGKLSEIFNVSHMTIRRDAVALEAMGKIVSVTGGIQLVSHLTVEPSHFDKLSLHHEEKDQIAALALHHIHDTDHSIYLDAGTTCLAIAHKIVHLKDRLFITNDLKTADFLLTYATSPVVFIGGELDKNNYSAVGNLASEIVQKLNIDLAFISTSSWSNKGISTPDIRKADVKKNVVASSIRNILVGDSSKYGQRASYHILELEAFERIITDHHFSQSAIDTLAEHNIRVEK